jgi:hypothetical protein
MPSRIEIILLLIGNQAIYINDIMIITYAFPTFKNIKI